MDPDDSIDNLEFSEDAHFVLNVHLPDEKHNEIKRFTYMGVADGVGSWREYGVDPRLFSRRLMEECQAYLVQGSGNGSFVHCPAPADIMAKAYEKVKAEDIIGSSTACVALFDGARHQLYFSNLGDCGIIVLRHIGSDATGSLKRETIRLHPNTSSDLQLAFISQQQLRSFNHPYQLGWTGEEIREGERTSFKTARDAHTTSFQLLRGDIVIMATDGLFDNVEMNDICSIAYEWEQRYGFIREGDTEGIGRRWVKSNSLSVLSTEPIHKLADRLCRQARENSLNNEVDSPFAILAKENDIMWSGGMPDDCTVLCFHVVGTDVVDSTNAMAM